MKHQIELWKRIECTQLEYYVSNFGNCKSKYRILAPVKSGNGYLTVALGKNNPKTIHRLVATAFIPNTDNKPQVNHIDGDKRNNNVSNLEWVNQSENMKHAYRIGLQSVSENQKIATRKYCKKHFSKKVIQLDLSGKIICTYPSASEAARKTGFCQTHISSCCRRVKKTCHKYKFQYA